MPPECRACKADITWVKTDAGKNMPVDTETMTDPGATQFDPDQGMVSHFATCPEADNFRKEKT